MTYLQLRSKYEKQLEGKVGEISELLEENADDIQKINLEFSKFNRYKNLVEECYLKDKLIFKRALILCKALLKQCGT